MKQTFKPDIRWMSRRDMDDVLDIEKRCFAWPDGWREEMFLKLLRQRNCIGTVTTEESQFENVVGFMIYELHPKKLELLRFAVHPDQQRKGYGAAMMQRLIDKLDQQRREVIGVDVPEHNVGTQIFLNRCGFRAAPAGDFVRMEYWL